MPGTAELVEVPELAFPVGLPGFTGLHRFALSRWGEPDSPYARLVCLDDPAVAFLVAPPEAFFDHYAVELRDEDAHVLQLDDPGDALVLVLITVRDRAEDATANLLGPLVVNTRTRRGLQIVLDDPGLSTTTPLRAA